MKDRNKMEDTVIKLRELGRDRKKRNDLLELVEKLDDNQVECIITKYLVTSSGHEALEGLLNGVPETPRGQQRRFKIFGWTLSVLYPAETAATVVRTAAARLQLELGRLSSAHLVKLTEGFVDRIRDDSDPHCSWKDLLPECLRVLAERGAALEHCGSELSPAQFTGQCVRALCLCSWDPTPVAVMFRDIPLNKEDHLQVVKKLCCDLENMSPESIPPLLHQLMRLCKEQHSPVVFFRLNDYFMTRLYQNLYSRDPRDSESPLMDMDSIVECEDEEAQRALATCVLVACGGGGAALRPTVAAIRNVAKNPAVLLAAPPLLHLLLSAEQLRDTAVQVIRLCLSNNKHEKELRAEFSWCRDAFPEEINTDVLFQRLVENSSLHCHMTGEGLLTLAVVLLGGGTSLRRAGRLLLSELTLHTPSAAAPALRALRDLLAAGNLHAAEALEVLIARAPQSLRGRISELQGLVEDCLSAGGAHVPRARVLGALRGTVRQDPRLRDTLIMACRKGLFSRDPGVGYVAVTGFLTLLQALRGSEDSLTQERNSNHSVLTQISIDVHSSHSGARLRVNNAAVCMEVVSLLRKCLNQSAEVKEQLYQGLPAAVLGRPGIQEAILELLHEHMASRYLAPGATPPLLVDNCILTRDTTVTLQEPLGSLLFCIHRILEGEKEEELHGPALKLQEVLQASAESLAQCNLSHFKLEDGVALNEGSTESRVQCLALQQWLSVSEALMAVALSRHAPPSRARVLLKLHNVHTQLLQCTKTSMRGKKVGEKAPKKSKKSQADKEAAHTTTTKSRGKGAEAPPFKAAPCLWNMGTCLVMFKALYDDDTEWATKEDLSQLRGRREVHRSIARAGASAAKPLKPGQTFFSQAGLCTNLLFRKCLSRLENFCDFDEETALLVVECFHEILSTVFTSYEERVPEFLTGIVGGSEEEAVEMLLESLSSQLQGVAEGVSNAEDVPARRLPGVVLRLFTLLLTRCHLVDKWVQFLLELCSREVGGQWPAALAVAPLLRLAGQGATPWQHVDTLAARLLQLLGSNSEDESLDESMQAGQPWACLSTASAGAAYMTLMQHLGQRVGALEAMAGRLRAHSLALQHCRPANLHAAGGTLKARERAACTEACRLVGVCHVLARSCAPPGPGCAAVLRLLSRLHALLAALAAHFTLRSTAQVLLAARFDRVMKLAGRPLSHAVDALIRYAEHASGNNGRAGVLRSTRHIPRLVYEAEQLAKRVTQLSAKTKFDLVCHLSKGSARDFRIRKAELHEALQGQGNAADDTDLPPTADHLEDSIRAEVDAAIDAAIVSDGDDHNDDGNTSNVENDSEDSATEMDSDVENRPPHKRAKLTP